MQYGFTEFVGPGLGKAYYSATIPMIYSFATHIYLNPGQGHAVSNAPYGDQLAAAPL